MDHFHMEATDSELTAMQATPRGIKTMTRQTLFSFVCLCCVVDGPARAADPGESVTDRAVEFLSRIETPPMKTLGGRQVWADVQFFHAWRIQRCQLDGHYRLLDGNDVRHASGTLEDCRRKLADIRTDQQLPPMKGRAVILVHGIVRSSKSFGSLKSALEADGAQVFGFDYPSTRVDIHQSAAFLHQVIESLEGIEEIDLVVHSMGGLVVRAYLQEHRDARLRRMVMLGVPNSGARLASMLQDNPVYRTVYGPAGQQLVDDPQGVATSLPTPDFEFAVIAGARGQAQGYNPLIPGDDDGTVSVESTRLPGASDFMTVRATHSFLMSHVDVIAATRSFLSTGALRSSGLKEPIPASPADAAHEAALPTTKAP